MRRWLWTLTTLAVWLVACDPFYQVIVTVPLARPVLAACAESTFDVIAHPRRVNPSDPNGRPLRGLAFVAGQPYGNLEQQVKEDGTALLETSVGRMSYLGGRFNKAEVDSITRQLSATLTSVRNACGGSAPAGAPPYRVKKTPF